MSDILPSTASPSKSSTSAAAHPSAPATTAPLSSEGPTLPILSASQTLNANGSGTGKKRKRTTVDTTTATSTAPATGEKHTSRAPGRTNHEQLYEPWELLPARERKGIEERGTEKVEAVVWTRNQNVRAGVNRLKALLCATPTAMGDKEDVVVAVSAQGEGTVKLVGIVDVGLRVVGEGIEGKEAGRKWFVYTVLSSVDVSRGRTVKGDELAGGKEGDAMDVDGDGEGEAVEDGGAVQEVTKTPGEGGTKKVPVLTVWMSTRRMAGWREVFGEREVVAYGCEE